VIAYLEISVAFSIAVSFMFLSFVALRRMQKAEELFEGSAFNRGGEGLYADPLDPAAALTDRGVYLSEDALRQSMLVADHDDALSDCDFESAHGGDEEDAHEARAASARKLTRNDSHRSEEAEKDKQPVSWSSYLFGTW
jgi:hypothetical protein